MNHPNLISSSKMVLSASLTMQHETRGREFIVFIFNYVHCFTILRRLATSCLSMGLLSSFLCLITG